MRTSGGPPFSDGRPKRRDVRCILTCHVPGSHRLRTTLEGRLIKLVSRGPSLVSESCLLRTPQIGMSSVFLEYCRDSQIFFVTLGSHKLTVCPPPPKIIDV